MLDIIQKIADLETVRPDPEQGIGRQCYAFSATEDRAFKLLENEAQKLFEAQGIDSSAYNIEIDAIGNLFITLYGQNRHETVMSGSHVDSVKNGGMYDGVAGVHSAFRLLESLLKSGQAPERNYTVAVFRAEEASPKTGNTCIGSRIATGTLKVEDLLKITYETDDGAKIPFWKFFQDKYGAARWLAVMDELKNPVIRKNEVVCYEELHIEQSAVCDIADADIGIVVDGIGGAIREVVNMPLEWKYVREFDLERAIPHLKYSLRFRGEEAHTGGTPPNPTALRQKNAPWYRKDALIGAAKFMEKLQRSTWNEDVKITTITIPEKVGFTTVPKEQNIEFLVPLDLWDHMEIFLANSAENLQKDSGVTLDYHNEVVESGKFQYFDSKIFQIMQIPLVVEWLVREKCQDQIKRAQGGVGRVRGTVTDFHIDEAGSLHCNLDFRDVDTKAIQTIIDQVHEEVAHMAKDLMLPVADHPVIHTVSCKPFAPLDKDAVEQKSRIAQQKNMKVMKMPSLPGHDAASLSYAGIKTAMTFARHKGGRSHCAEENLAVSDYLRAEEVSHEFIRQELGLVAK